MILDVNMRIKTNYESIDETIDVIVMTLEDVGIKVEKTSIDKVTDIKVKKGGGK